MVPLIMKLPEAIFVDRDKNIVVFHRTYINGVPFHATSVCLKLRNVYCSPYSHLLN